ncbi:MAG TPA: WhiB family transcriptional regulator [Intrasporangiaceae bacterium]|nr:WhiB family transcriptional regulator [Intrasporangiaceae bacterium]
MTLVAHPPTPAAHLWDWQQQGACRVLPPEMFFHPEGERGKARAQRIERAKEVCAACPVIVACREHALAIREPYGVWGGLDEEERAREHARRGLGVA